jgi:NAD(P)-dependent dehydrogenase (short-subunit alcohol dehydrogenase family)
VLAKDGIAEREKAVVAGRALRRSQQPEDLIGAVCFLRQRSQRLRHRQSLIVDGGGIMQ